MTEQELRDALVAPLTGAWIETLPSRSSGSRSSVAPLTGAWIETASSPQPYIAWLLSRPSRARGSKHDAVRRREHQPRVAPLTGAWIETTSSRRARLVGTVAPLTGAWIETREAACELPPQQRRAPHGRVDRNRSAKARPAGMTSRAPHGRVDRNSLCWLSGLSQSRVAPLTGAWIETSVSVSSIIRPSSRPSRARGSKRRASLV